MNWNCRGIGKPRTIHTLLKYLRSTNPDVIFLMETKKNSHDMERIRLRLGMDSCLSIDAIGRSGGLALLWKSDINLTIKSYSKNHIDSEIALRGKSWRLMGFYGNPSVTDRHQG